MGTLSLTLPVIGQPNSTEDVKIPNALTAIQTLVNTNLDYANLNSVVDSYYKTIMSIDGSIIPGTAGGTYILTQLGQQANPATNVVMPAFRYLDSARYPSGTRSQKLSLSAALLVDGTAPATNIAFGLREITAVGGAAGATTLTVGATLMAFTFTTPSANSRNHQEAADIVFPAASYYVLSVDIGGTIAANCTMSYNVNLDFRAV